MIIVGTNEMSKMAKNPKGMGLDFPMMTGGVVLDKPSRSQLTSPPMSPHLEMEQQFNLQPELDKPVRHYTHMKVSPSINNMEMAKTVFMNVLDSPANEDPRTSRLLFLLFKYVVEREGVSRSREMKNGYPISYFISSDITDYIPASVAIKKASGGTAHFVHCNCHKCNDVEKFMILTASRLNHLKEKEHQNPSEMDTESDDSQSHTPVPVSEMVAHRLLCISDGFLSKLEPGDTFRMVLPEGIPLLATMAQLALLDANNEPSETLYAAKHDAMTSMNILKRVDPAWGTTVCRAAKKRANNIKSVVREELEKIYTDDLKLDKAKLRHKTFITNAFLAELKMEMLKDSFKETFKALPMSIAEMERTNDRHVIEDVETLDVLDVEDAQDFLDRCLETKL